MKMSKTGIMPSGMVATRSELGIELGSGIVGVRIRVKVTKTKTKKKTTT